MDIRKPIISPILSRLIFLFLLLTCQFAYAEVINPDTIISSPTTYSNTVLDMTNGNFIIQKGASLTIENSSIVGTISPTNKDLFLVELGTLNLTNNQVHITASGIEQTPKADASFYVIRLGRASANFTGNSFIIDKEFSAGFLTSNLIQPVEHVTIANNKFQHFHGVLYLLNASNILIDGNQFKLNSGGNIVFVGHDGMISNNSIYFAGLNQFGDAISIVNSEKVHLSKNNIFTATAESLAITLSRNIVVDSNTITGGITYAIRLFSHEELKKLHNTTASILARLNRKDIKFQGSRDITISNNFMSQNRYGLYAVDTQNLIVNNNFFSQRFATPEARKFWTDNNILLKNVTSLSWTGNIYKEAFTQENEQEAELSFVIFPETGGVVL